MSPRWIGPLVVVASLLCSPCVSAAVLHVPADYPTIQQALSAASSGDEVLVAPGTYKEHLVIDSPQNGVKLHSEAGAAVTIIDGGGFLVLTIEAVGPGTEVVGFTLQNGSGGIRVMSASPLIAENIIRQNQTPGGGGGINLENSPATVQRNEIRDNRAAYGGGIRCGAGSIAHIDDNIISGNQAADGGGLTLDAPAIVTGNHFLSNVATTGGGGAVSTGADGATFRNNEFRANSASSGAGGAIRTQGVHSSTIDGNVFVGNYSLTGGAIWASASASPLITSNVFLDNQAAAGYGGAIDCDIYVLGTIERNLIIRNRASVSGGGVSVVSSSNVTLTSNTLVLNQAPLGGALYVDAGSHATVGRNIVSHTADGGGIVVGTASAISLQCNDVWGNTGGNYSGVLDYTGTSGNISSDPLFCDLGAFDLHLTAPSLCSIAHSGCAGIGALDVGCTGSVPTQPITWGRMKAVYR